jgi:proteic killer suppression protein
MDILFKNKKLRKTFNSFESLKKEYGHKQAKKIKMRLDQLQAMSNLSIASQFPQLRCHELKGNRRGQLAVDLDQPYRLIFSVAHDPPPRKEDGGLDWSRVEAIQIEGVEDYHD